MDLSDAEFERIRQEESPGLELLATVAEQERQRLLAEQASLYPPLDPREPAGPRTKWKRDPPPTNPSKSVTSLARDSKSIQSWTDD